MDTQRLCGVEEVNHLNICVQVECNNFCWHWMSCILKSTGSPTGYICEPGCNAVDRAPLLSLGKVQLGPLKYPSPLQLCLHDLMEMRGAGSLPKKAVLSCGHNERHKQGKYRLTACVCVLCVLSGIHKCPEDWCVIEINIAHVAAESGGKSACPVEAL